MLATQIGLRWHRSLNGIFEVCQLAAYAAKKLKSKEKKLLMERLGMKKSYFSKLVKIGSDKRLQLSNVLPALLPNVTFLYTVTGWTDEEIALFVRRKNSGKPITAAQSQEHKSWCGVSSRRIPVAANRVILFGSEMTAELACEVDAILNELERKYPLQVDSRSHPSFDRTYTIVEDFPRTPAPLDLLKNPQPAIIDAID